MADDDTTAEALRLMSSMTQDGIEEALHRAFALPVPVQQEDRAGGASLEVHNEVHNEASNTAATAAAAAAAKRLLQAAAKCGVPKTEGDLVANDALRAALMRHAVHLATVGGATWRTAAWAGAFDMKLLFDGPFRQGLAHLGIGGLFGTVGGLSSWMSHPFFGNGLVLGILCGSALGAVSLASTGDWARFGKGLGLGAVGTAAAWGGATMGASVGAVLGPAGAVVGGLVGGVSAAFYGRRAALQIPGLGGLTDYEVDKMHEAIVAELAAAGLEPDPSLSPKEVVAATTAMGQGDSGSDVIPFRVRMTDAMAVDVEAFRGAVLALQKAAPEGYGVFVEELRTAAVKATKEDKETGSEVAEK